jgi:modulator of FtsH protease HflK
MDPYYQSGGGPWGGGPWGGGGGGGGGGSPWGGRPGGPRGRGPQPPNLDELLRKGQEQVRRMMPGGLGSGRGIIIIAAILVLVWLMTGIYRVQPDELGVVLRFGQYNRTATPGLNYHLPAPIESVQTPKVTRENIIFVGFTGEGARGGSRQLPQEALMLTGDENIVDINFTVFWLIKDAKDFLFNVRAPEQTVKAAAESAMREVVGRTPIAQVLTEGRGKIQDDTQRLLQEVLDSYKAGITITRVVSQKVDPPDQVIDAFRDVQRARADQERLRNEAEAYRNNIIPVARGEAVKLEQDAEAYKQEIVARSQGEAQRFVSVYDSYKVAPDVTAKRLYLETMEEILKGTQKVIIDRAAEGGNGVIPYLPLPELRRMPAQGGSTPRAQQPGFTPAPQPPTPGGQTQRGAPRP